jgi:hypothetical protein
MIRLSSDFGEIVVGYVLNSLHAGGLEGGCRAAAPPNFFFQADIFLPSRHISRTTYFQDDILSGPHDIRWFFGTWFLPMVFYFRLRN